MTKSFKSLFPSLNVAVMITVLAMPVAFFIISHYGTDNFFKSFSDNHFSTLFMLTLYCSAISVYFAFDGISKNNPNRIPLLRALPAPRKAAKTAVIELVIFNIITISANCTTSVLFPSVFESVIPEPPRIIPIMIFCTMIFFGVYLFICTLSNSAIVFILMIIFAVLFEIPMELAKSGRFYTSVLIGTAICAAISVTAGTAFAASNIGRRIAND